MLKLTVRWGRKKIRAMRNENTWIPQIKTNEGNCAPPTRNRWFREEQEWLRGYYIIPGIGYDRGKRKC